MAKLSNKYIGNVGDSFRPLTGNGIFNFGDTDNEIENILNKFPSPHGERDF